MPLIKRYANRKLYDTAARRYVTLAEVSDMLRLGEELTIVDHDSGEDLTTLVMLQALVDDERRSGAALTNALLEKLVSKGERIFRNVRENFLLPVRLVDDEIQHRLELLVQRGTLGGEEAARIASLLKSVAPAEAEAEGADAFQALQAQIAALEQELAELQGHSFEQKDSGA